MLTERPYAAMSLDIVTQIVNPPLDHVQAVELDRQIQAMAANAGKQLDSLFPLLVEAKAGEIHEVLEFDSWTAYLANRLKPIAKALDADGRRALISELYEAGMSVRATAEAVGASKSTVARQVSQSGTGGLGTEAVRTTGTDGKEYPRRNGNGGHRGPLDVVMKLRRAGSAIGNITGLSAEDVKKQAEICRLIDQLIADIEPASNPTRAERD